jgi:N-succinyldiaminopimelate aminotransferase
MNPDLQRLHAYPFERLAALLRGVQPPAHLSPILMSIGEPRHAAPAFVLEELHRQAAGYSQYPKTQGNIELRESICDWLARRYALPRDGIDAALHVLPVNGSREALFSFTQCVIDRQGHPAPAVAMPNPFYQIYEGAALLAGAEPLYLPEHALRPGVPDFAAVAVGDWQRCQLLVVCSPANPTGAVLDQHDWRLIFELADRHDFVIASDECYSELYQDESTPPLGILQACRIYGRDRYQRCMAFHSLSKRSNLPGMRSGFVAGDAALIRDYLLYRTYHGSAMPVPHQHASAVAWADEQHVRENRALYRAKFSAVIDELDACLPVERPQGGFYLWPSTPCPDEEFARELFRNTHVTVLPGSYLSRAAAGGNPGSQRVRLALVAEHEVCLEAARRIRQFVATL